VIKMANVKNSELIVRKIKNGTVIDHITAGNAINVLRILGIKGSENITIAVVMNVKSKKLGKKDIVKIENRELTPEEVNIIALIAPHATINIIKDYKVVAKHKVKVPERVIGLIKCSNPNCITRQTREPVTSVFKVVSREPLILKCEYCGRYITSNEIVEQLSRW